MSRLLSLGIYRNVLLEGDWKCRTRQSSCSAEHAQFSRHMHALPPWSGDSYPDRLQHDAVCLKLSRLRDLVFSRLSITVRS